MPDRRYLKGFMSGWALWTERTIVKVKPRKRSKMLNTGGGNWFQFASPHMYVCEIRLRKCAGKFFLVWKEKCCLFDSIKHVKKWHLQKVFQLLTSWLKSKTLESAKQGSSGNVQIMRSVSFQNIKRVKDPKRCPVKHRNLFVAWRIGAHGCYILVQFNLSMLILVHLLFEKWLESFFGLLASFSDLFTDSTKTLKPAQLKYYDIKLVPDS